MADPSTVVDMTGGTPRIIRQGKVDFVACYIVPINTCIIGIKKNRVSC